MLDYVISLFDDVNDFSWDVAKASHAVFLCRIEQGEVKEYSQIDKRYSDVPMFRGTVCPHLGIRPRKKHNQKHAKSITCNYFNAGTWGLGEYCTNTYAQPVLKWASLLSTQKLKVDQKPKKFQ